MCGTAICTNFPSKYAPKFTIFIAALEKNILSNRVFGGGTLTIYFFSWEGGEDSLKEFMNEIN